jgi:hypothetical protein
MTWIDPDQLERERGALLEQIRMAFWSVSREGGVSWNEARVIDGYGTEEQRAAARETDRDVLWEDLIDDPDWDPDTGSGGFCFLDAIGFRYYLPAAMTRAVRTGWGGSILFHLERARDEHPTGSGKDDWRSLLTEEQSSAVRSFLLFLESFALSSSDWQEAHECQRIREAFWRDGSR